MFIHTLSFKGFLCIKGRMLNIHSAVSHFILNFILYVSVISCMQIKKVAFDAEMPFSITF